MGSTNQIAPKRRGIRCSIQYVISVFMPILVISIVYIYIEGKSWVYDVRRSENEGGSSSSDCNLFLGKWVYDYKSYPLYREQNCPFEMYGFACEKGGRQDLNYQYWRWQPHNCDLPRFNATAMLERLRGKRLVFVGDSLASNQWASLVCLLESSIPKPLRMVYPNGSFAIFKSKVHNATIEHYWTPYLVDSNSDHPVFHHSAWDQIVRVQAIEKHARHWTDADVLIFNSYLWWRRPKIKLVWGSFLSNDGIYKEVDGLRAYEMALKSWADWLEIHVNRTRTQLFFTTGSATHMRAEEWSKATNQTCYGETEPILKDGYWGNGSDPGMMRKIEEAVEGLKIRGLKVQILNITQLTEYRKEGHPSIYKKRKEPLSKEQLANPTSYADCVHWCLPGVPDVWNEILYVYIVHNDKLK